jgi:4Fe-4S ferredoxin
MLPVIKLGKCEGDGICIDVCSDDVFRIEILKPEQIERLTLKEKIKSYVHGHKKAVVINPKNCCGCGLCEVKCPHQAISMV